MGSVNPNSDLSYSSLCNIATNYAAYYTQNPNFSQHQTSFYSQLRPPGVETTSYVSQPSVASAAAQPPAQQTIVHDPNVAADAAAASYYVDQNVMLQNWAAALRQMALPYASGISAPNPVSQSKKTNAWAKYPKKTKIVQSAWCEVCKIDCNSKGVLDQHKLGKKHQKNLEKSRAATAPVHFKHADAPSLLAPAVAPPAKPVIGPEENPNKSKAPKGENSQKKAVEKTEDLETKKRKVLEGGAAADAVRTCIICNVVCNSETVFNYHLAGQKHASMIKKYASTAGVT
ncbi:hypothetical protein F511_21973 [Dorcoceras hygrometricum]|uniref:U1-type domain-containing protein n=1 Tax=Dorcoceras hygrometricum TaxID=472368 RepID=A0A2Z7CCD4_9LAMI|nr:hypothetical protein F511_21973 [Dorcoceras hygrometricum]